MCSTDLLDAVRANAGATALANSAMLHGFPRTLPNQVSPPGGTVSRGALSAPTIVISIPVPAADTSTGMMFPPGYPVAIADPGIGDFG
jgi:hypothetical protein